VKSPTRRTLLGRELGKATRQSSPRASSRNRSKAVRRILKEVKDSELKTALKNVKSSK